MQVALLKPEKLRPNFDRKLTPILTVDKTGVTVMTIYNVNLSNSIS